jgi:hypothetical protein
MQMGNRFFGKFSTIELGILGVDKRRYGNDYGYLVRRGSGNYDCNTTAKSTYDFGIRVNKRAIYIPAYRISSSINQFPLLLILDGPTASRRIWVTISFCRTNPICFSSLRRFYSFPTIHPSECSIIRQPPPSFRNSKSNK